MKIEKVTLYHLELPLKTPFVTPFGPIAARSTLLVRLESEGHTGWGASAHLPLPVYLPEYLESGKILLARHILPRALGTDVSRPEDVQHSYAGIRGNNLSKAGLETAAWDLLAKKDSLPLYKRLGSGRNTAQVGMSIGIKGEQELLEDIARGVSDGYKRIKVKIKRGSDVEVVRKIREHYPDLPLMVDANSSYALDDIDTFKQLDRYNLLMIEQPLGDDDIVDHAALQREINTSLCLDESIRSAADARRAAQLGSCRVINIKPGRVGGLGESLEILTVCRERNLGAWIGGMLESGIGRAFLNHVATAEGVNFPGDLNPGNSYLVEDIALTPEPVDGVITLGDAPGIGVQVNEEVLEKYLVEKIMVGR